MDIVLVFVLVIALTASISFAFLYLLRVTPVVYATAATRVKAARLMIEKNYEELLSRDLEDFPSFFDDTGYGKYITESRYEDIESGLLRYEKDMDYELFGLIPKNWSGAFDFLIKKWDIANLRRVLLGIHADIPEEEVRESLVDAGYMYDTIPGLVGRDMDGVVSALADTAYDIREGLEEYKMSKNYSFIDLLLEKRMFESVVAGVAQSGERKLKILNEYLQVLAESLDLKAMLRGKASGVSAEEMRRFLMKIEVEREYEDTKDVKEFLVRLMDTRYSYLIENGGVREGEGGDIMDIERKIETQVLRKGKELTVAEAFGLGPVISFLVMKEVEIRNIRLIAKSKADGVSAEKIREHLLIL